MTRFNIKIMLLVSLLNNEVFILFFLKNRNQKTAHILPLRYFNFFVSNCITEINTMITLKANILRTDFFTHAQVIFCNGALFLQ